MGVSFAGKAIFNNFSEIRFISFLEPTCLWSAPRHGALVIKFPDQDFRSFQFQDACVPWFTTWPIISLYPSLITSLWDFSPKSKMGWSLEHKGLQQQRQIFVFTSLVGVFCAIFVWNSRSPALSCSDLFTSNFTSGSFRITLANADVFPAVTWYRRKQFLSAKPSDS